MPIKSLHANAKGYANHFQRLLTFVCCLGRILIGILQQIKMLATISLAENVDSEPYNSLDQIRFDSTRIDWTELDLTGLY